MEEESKQEQTQTAQEEKRESEGPVKDDVKDNKLWAVLSYLGALAILPLLFKKDSVFVQFHAKQGLIILAGWVLGWLPFGFLFVIAAIVFSIMGIINVLNGEKKSLPIVGELAEKINL